MNLTRTELTLAAAGAALASILLVALFRFPDAFPVGSSDVAVLGGQVTLSAADVSRYQKFTGISLGIDTVFIFASMLAWLGIADSVRRRGMSSWAMVIFAFGILGAGLDLLENTIIWTLIDLQRQGYPPQLGVVTAWTVVQQASYWPTYVAALLTALLLPWRGWPATGLGLLGTIGVFVAGAAVYVSSLAPTIWWWWILWFAFTAWLLARDARSVRSG
jgi:hypothetical protein